MKIDFISTDPRIEIGSYRIWVHDLSQMLRFLGHDARVLTDPRSVRVDSVVIFSKGDYLLAKDVNCRARGAINISSDTSYDFLDFIIVGSIEEKLSVLRNYDNVHIVNLIEAMYENFDLKQHENKKTLTIGYHGSYTHLSKVQFGFVKAFNSLKEDGLDIRFKTVTNQPKFATQICNQLGLNAEHSLWNFKTIASEIKEFDIGIVINCSDITQMHPQLMNLTNTHSGLYTTDYAYRYKNKSNPGRNFVLYQLGIPVICDLTPSNIPMIFDESCGKIAACEKTWKMAIQSLKQAEVRNFIARNAKNRFLSMYNREKEALDLVSFLEKLS